MKEPHANLTPETVFRKLLDGIAADQWDALAELYAEDAIVRLPFALPEPITLSGRDEIAAHFHKASTSPFSLTPTNLRIHELRDREQIFAEYDYELRHRQSLRLFTVSNVQWLQIRDGRIVASCDYHNHAALARAAAG